MDTLFPDPKRIKKVDRFNGVAILFSVAIFLLGAAIDVRIVSEALRALGAGMVAVPVMYFAARAWLYDPNVSAIEEFFGPDDKIFEISKRTLENIVSSTRGRILIRIYAPVGLWYPSQLKDEWLDTVSRLAHKNRVMLRGVFGLPPTRGEELEDEVNRVGQRLRLLMNSPNSEIRFFSPPREDQVDTHGEDDIGRSFCSETPAPGLGIIIIGEELAMFGITPSGVGSGLTKGFVVTGPRVIENIRDWFDTQAFSDTASHPLSITKSAIDYETPEMTKTAEQKIDARHKETISKLVERFYPRVSLNDW